MNGHPISTNCRRDFFKKLLGVFAAPLLLPALEGCYNTLDLSHIKGDIVGANSKTGHLLRTQHFGPPTTTEKTEILIIGGGISGLSAKRWLQQNNVADVMLIEMDTQLGGNSISGSNHVSAYPWGAHYLPLPDPKNKELLEFLHSIDVIKGFNADGLPIYNEYHLCHDPEERLFINGAWQEGLIPQLGISETDQQQIKKFLAEMEVLKAAKGNDDKDCFCIPLDETTTDEKYKILDNLTFDEYLQNNGYNSKYLRWYLEYCCKDDYGSNLHQTSAWAGLHYFASRKGKAANAQQAAVLTWPEGNAFLMNGLRKQAGNNNLTNELAFAVNTCNDGVEVLCFDVHSNTSRRILAKKVLMATPQYVTNKLLSHHKRTSIATYAPWVVANVTLNNMPPSKGMQLCWDNVIFGQESVGYVYANHQNLISNSQGVITCYLPITNDNTISARQQMHETPYSVWKERIVKDLSFAHKNIAQHITHIDIWIWGHGMVRPSVGYIWGKERQMAMQPIENKIFFAHTDLSGVSIFEEAFYQGIRVAKKMMQS